MLLTSCTETNTTDAQEAYKYWAGSPPTAQVKVARGRYWQSAHFTREYVVYLDLTAPADWSREYIRQNNLLPDTNAADAALPTDAPRWFKPDSSFLKYGGLGTSGSYYLQPRTGRMLIYEAQF